MNDRRKQNGAYVPEPRRPIRNKECESSDLKQGVSLHTAAFSVLLVGVAIVCAVFRNTLFDHASSLWQQSGDFVSVSWGHFYDYFEGDWTKMGIALHVIAMLEYWGLGGFFLISDLTGRPSFITQYKVQSDQTEIPVGKLSRLLWVVFLNQTVYSVPILVSLYYVMRARGCSATVDDLPTFHGFLLELIFFSAVEEIGFYYSHRLLHYGVLYKTLHKKHHEWTAPIGLVASYCNPIEYFLSNIFPVVLGPILIRSHLLSTATWLYLAVIMTIITHSGYHLPLAPSPEYHDYHHLKFTDNFGVFGILDWLHGTDLNFRKSKQFLRHKTFVGLTPMKNQIPDEPKKK